MPIPPPTTRCCATRSACSAACSARSAQPWRRALYDDHRERAPDRDTLPARRQPAGRPGARPLSSSASTATPPSAWCAPSATSRSSRTSPRTEPGPAAARAGAPAGCPSAHALAALEQLHALGAAPGQIRAALARACADAGADRAPHRGPAQEHPRHRARDRAPARRARTRRARASGIEVDEQLLGALIATLWQTRMLRTEKLTVADEIDQRARLLAQHFPARAAAPVRRARAGARHRPQRGPKSAVVPAPGQLDRR